MPEQRDTVLIEQARIQRNRLGSALVFGHIGERRTINDHMKRLMGSIIVAAVACAACVGVSFVSQLLADRAEAAASSTSAPVVPTAPSEAP